MTVQSTGLFEKKIREGLKYYVRATAILILPVFYFVILYFLAARAWETAAFQINMLFAQKLSLRVIILFSIYPIGWVCVSAKRLFLFDKHPLFSKVIYIILLGGIVSAHIVTWLAVRAGQYPFFTFESLIRYDLMLLDIYVYWKSDREGMEIGIKVLSILIWLSAIHGIAEFIFQNELVLFSSNEVRARSVYTNPIISGSVWLMAFWMHSLGKKDWLNGFVKCCYVAAIFFTVSKDAWIGLGASVILYLIWNRKSIAKKWNRQQRCFVFIYIVVLLVLFIGVLFLNDEYRNFVFLRWTNVQTDSSFIHRLYHVQDTLQYLVHDAPFVRKIFGFGNSLSREFIKSTPHFTGLTNLDNQYLITLYEFGLLGLLCLLLWAVVCCSAAKRGDSWQKAAGMGIVAMLIPIGTYDPFQWEIVTFLLLLLSVIALTGNIIQPSKAAIRKTARTVVCILMVGLLIAWVWPCVISWYRTLYNSLLDLYVGKQVFLVMLCFVTGIVVTSVVVYFLIYSLLAFSLPGKKTIVTIGILFAISFVWIGWGNWKIAAEEKKLISSIKEVFSTFNKSIISISFPSLSKPT